MAAIYRFGFEGGNFPDGIIVSGSYSIINGRSGVSSSAVRGNGTTPSYVDATIKQATQEIYSTFYFRVDATNSGNETTLFQFGPTEVTYTPSTTLFQIKSNGSSLGSIIQPVQLGVFYPISVHSYIAQVSGSLSFFIENVGASFVGDTLLGSSNVQPEKIRFGIGATTSVAQLSVDDVAINDIHSYSNISGSYGVGLTEMPPFITAKRTFITGSEINQWVPLDSYGTASVIDIVNEVVDSYIKSYLYNQTTRFIPVPIDTQTLKSFEGVNIYFENNFSISETGSVYLYGYLQVSGSGSVNQSGVFEMSSIPKTNNYTAIEKDFGGQLTVDDFNNSRIYLSPKKFINKNYFGLGSLGSVIYTSSAVIGNSTDDFVFLDYDNLTIASGSFVTTSIKNRGLIIYVRGNCVIEGTLSVDGKGHSGSLSDTSSIIWKNTSSLFITESSSLSTGSSWVNETLYQPYLESTSSLFGVSTYSNGGLPGQNGVDGIFGGGGGGGSTDQASGGKASTSSLFGGGTGGSGAGSGSSANDTAQYGGVAGSVGIDDGGFTFGGYGATDAGGCIYLFVGKNLILGPTGIITATGSNGNGGGAILGHQSGGGGGAGGGNINLFYGLNYYNLGGSIRTNGGTGGSGLNGGQNGGSGGSGSYQITKLLTN